jgi:hypothetical protein
MFLIWILYFQKMMCNFVARTNWSNIESNYFMHTKIVFNLPYDTNVMITVTFINQVMLSHTFLLLSPENYPHKSSAIFQINVYVFDIHMEIPNSTHKLHHVKQVAVFQNEPFTIPYGRINHLCRHWNKRMLTIVQNTFYSRRTWWLPLVDEKYVIDNLVAISINFFWLGLLLKTPITAVVLDGFLLLMKGLSSTAQSPFPSVFFALGVTIKAAKPNCILPIGDDGSSYKNRSSGKLIVMKNQWNTALMEASVVSIMRTPAFLLWFPKNWLLLRISFLFSIDRQLYSHDRFLKISTTFCVSRNWWIIVVFL